MAQQSAPESPPGPASPVQVPAASTAVQVDEDAGGIDVGTSDSDSSLGNDVLSSTASMSSSILDYRRENGRTYHAYRDGKYQYPNDEEESERLDLQHHIWYLTLGGQLGLAPPNQKGWKGGNVLDTGTGTGIWAMDFGDEHPESSVIGVDLSPIQPAFVPPNVQFQIDDIEDEWTFTQPFDYIHSRAMNSSLQDWHAYLKNCYDNLKPGGWLEVQEFSLAISDDGTLKEESALNQAVQVMTKGGASVGRAFINVRTQLRPWFDDIGFVNITQLQYHWPSNSWPRDKKLKEIGLWTNTNVSSGMDTFILAYATRILGWSNEQVQVLAAQARKDLNDRTIHAYWPM
ncbi:S-adenosyl-L-methionine-dependent methyltransferase [Bombardia bombarda]|uniref:S-adenosyl-L-methionine-dependent methyltransferase n=1 Tax=Bombardia bombarda TaxID=252184 RepID=A0AA40CF19_9PEZI|nr:S-adenosyl-L-methionine-dependent methyltransferase [Bombardia bombarda]